MANVIVAVITFKRPNGLKRLLLALAEQQVGEHDVQMLVVDNACQPEVEALVHDVAMNFPFRLTYEAEAARGIVAARNKCVEVFLASDAEHLLFIDDDSWPTNADWVRSMLGKQAEFGSDIVAGPTQSLSGKGAPEWANQVMHDFGGWPDGTPISTFYTCNVLISRRVLEHIKPAFDQRFRMSGGSDYHFSLKCRKAGFKAIYANAEVEEEFPASRATVKWFILRGYRSGAAYARAHRFEDGIWAGLVKSLVMAFVRVGRGCGYLLFGLLTANKARLVNGLFRIASGCGTVSGLFGARYDEYNVIHGN